MLDIDQLLPERLLVTFVERNSAALAEKYLNSYERRNASNELIVWEIMKAHRVALSRSFNTYAAPDLLPKPQLELLEKYGTWLEALMYERLEIFSPFQQHFLFVCKGKAEPVNDLENAWVNYVAEFAYIALVQLASECGSSVSYKKVRDDFYRLAALGNDRAREWLEKEGLWKEMQSIGKGAKSWNLLSLYGINEIYRG